MLIDEKWADEIKKLDDEQKNKFSPDQPVVGDTNLSPKKQSKKVGNPKTMRQQVEYQSPGPFETLGVSTRSTKTRTTTLVENAKNPLNAVSKKAKKSKEKDQDQMKKNST